MTQKQQLFNYIHSLGAMLGNDIVILDNTSEQGKRDGETHYQVFVKGGLRFDISRENDEKEGKPLIVYLFYIHWDGPFNATNASDVLQVINLLREK